MKSNLPCLVGNGATTFDCDNICSFDKHPCSLYYKSFTIVMTLAST
jgi:hypothetical protein